MLCSNDLLCLDELSEMVRRQFGVSAPPPEFIPVGEDSWAYRCGPLWVSVRRDLRGHFPPAYELSRRLNQAGMNFIVAPIQARDGSVVQTVSGLPVVVFPRVEAQPVGRQRLVGDERSRLVALLSELQASNLRDGAPVEDFRFPFDDELRSALAALTGRDPDLGPYSLRAHRLVNQFALPLQRLMQEARDAARACAAESYRGVLTHGDPSTANVLRGDRGLSIVDWGGLMTAPAERDWFHVQRCHGICVPTSARLMRFYGLRWSLSEIAEYCSVFAGAHSGDGDERAMWGRLNHYVEGLTAGSTNGAVLEVDT